MSQNEMTPAQQKTYTSLINSGLQLILQKGYENISVVDITNNADYGRSTFYLYFKDKQDMAWHLLKYQVDQLDAFLLNTLADIPSPQREWQAWKIMFEQIDRQKEFFLKLDSELSYKLRQMQKHYLIQQFEKNLQSGFFQIGIHLPHDIGARFMVGTVLEIMDYWLQNPTIGTPEQMATHIYRIIFHQSPDSPLLESNHTTDDRETI